MLIRESFIRFIFRKYTNLNFISFQFFIVNKRNYTFLIIEILSKMLTDKKFNVQTEVYKGLEHMGTAIPTFESGIQLFLTK